MFIKFIIPAYNAAKTLPKMLDSILGQTFQDFKVIVVDDMSTDSTWDIIQQYQADYPEHVIGLKSEKKVYGGGARNIGISYQLESVYTWFVDADDALNGNDVLQLVYDEWKSTNADVIKIDCDKWNYHDWPAPWWRILKSEFVCEFQPGIRFKNDTANFYLVLDKIEGKKAAYVKSKPLYCYSGSHNKNKAGDADQVFKWLCAHKIQSSRVFAKIVLRFKDEIKRYCQAP